MRAPPVLVGVGVGLAFCVGWFTRGDDPVRDLAPPAPEECVEIKVDGPAYYVPHCKAISGCAPGMVEIRGVSPSGEVRVDRCAWDAYGDGCGAPLVDLGRTPDGAHLCADLRESGSGSGSGRR